MKTLPIIQKEFALEKGYQSYPQLIEEASPILLLEAVDVISERYAKEYAKSKLQEAAERATVIYDGNFLDPYKAKVDKESIINTPI